MDGDILLPATADPVAVAGWQGQVTERLREIGVAFRENAVKYSDLKTEISSNRADVRILSDQVMHIDRCTDETKEIAMKLLAHHERTRNRWSPWLRGSVRLWRNFKTPITIIVLAGAYWIARHIFHVPQDLINDLIKDFL